MTADMLDVDSLKETKSDPNHQNMFKNTKYKNI